MMEDKKELKRFYKTASTKADAVGFLVLLDGRATKTPAGNMVVAPSEKLALAVCEEWNAQGDIIDFAIMPLSALLSAAIDFVGSNENPLDEILAFLKSDLLCYRADGPEKLVARQKEEWDPYLDWFLKTYGAALNVTSGIMAIDQPTETIYAVETALKDENPIRLYGVMAATKISGSAVLGLAMQRGAFSSDALYAAAHVDEDFQAEKWGVDEGAANRRQRIAKEFAAIERFLSLLA